MLSKVIFTCALLDAKVTWNRSVRHVIHISLQDPISNRAFYILCHHRFEAGFIGCRKIPGIMSEKQVTKAELARRLKIRPQSVDYLLTRKSIDTDTLYNISLALDYDFALLYSIKKEQINLDKTISDIKVHKAKVTVELELETQDIIKLNLKKRLNKLLDK